MSRALFVMGGVVFLVGTFNYIYETLGPTAKTVFWMVGILLCCLGGASLLLRRPSAAQRVAVGGTAILGLVLGGCIALRSGRELGAMRREGERFCYRVDGIVESTVHLYRSTYMPEPLYRVLKRVLGKPYHPEVVDRVRSYDEVTVRAFHIGAAGIIEYTMKGSGDPVEAGPVHFVFMGETAAREPRRLISVHSCDGGELRSSVFPLTLLGQFLAAYGTVDVPREFCFKRSFCAPTGMTQRFEGFVVNLDNIDHPPSEVLLQFVTDHSVQDLRVSRLRRRGLSARQWVNAAPLYREEVLAYPSRVEGGDLLDEVIGGSHRTDADRANVLAYEARFSCEKAGNIFLLAYTVDTWYRPDLEAGR